eukprot:PRCOL_00002570-RA
MPHHPPTTTATAIATATTATPPLPSPPLSRLLLSSLHHHSSSSRDPSPPALRVLSHQQKPRHPPPPPSTARRRDSEEDTPPPSPSHPPHTARNDDAPTTPTTTTHCTYAQLAARVAAARAALLAALAPLHPNPNRPPTPSSSIFFAIAEADASAPSYPQTILQLAAATASPPLAFTTVDLKRWPAGRVAGALEACGARLLLAPAAHAREAAAAAARSRWRLVARAAEDFVPDLSLRATTPCHPPTTPPTTPEEDHHHHHHHRDPSILSTNTNSSQEALYVQFTSGSTGAPKGVLCAQSHAAAYATARADAERIRPGSVVMLASALTFDPHQADVFGAVARGATLAIAPRAALLAEPVAALAACGATHVCMTAATWALSLPAPPRLAPPPALRVVALGGEPMRRGVVEAWARAVELRNVYGVTEACAYQTFHRMRPGEDPMCIGAPLPCCAVDLVPDDSGEEEGDDHHAAASIGVLRVRGPTVASGYLGGERGALTEAFATDERNVRSFLTNDLAYERAPDELVFVGRRDGQVKIAGARVELGEVEAALGTCPLVAGERGVAAVTVLAPTTHGSPAAADDDAQRAPSNPTQLLVGLVVPHPSEEIQALPWDAACERAAIGACAVLLPQHAVPSRVLPIGDIPLTASGKVDRRALARFARAALGAEAEARRARALVVEQEQEPPLSRLERAVAGVWAAVLGAEVADVLADSSFLALGGNSLAALRASRMLQRVVVAPRSSEAATVALAAVERGIDAGEAAVLAAGARRAAKEKAAAWSSEEEDAACLFGLDMGALAPCELVLRPVLREYAAFLSGRGVTVSGDAGAQQPHRQHPPLGNATAPADQTTHCPQTPPPPPPPPPTPTLADRLLIQTCGEGRGAVARALLATGASSPDAALPDGFGALHAAAAAGATECVGALLDAGASPGATTAAGTTAAHLAAAGAHATALALLIDRGPAGLAGAKDGDRQTALHLAARSGDAATARVAAGACARLKNRRGGLESWDRWGRTAAQVAAEMADEGVLEALREAGAAMAAAAPAALLAREGAEKPERKKGAKGGHRHRDAAELVAALVAEVASAARDDDDDAAVRATASLRQLVCANASNRAAAAAAGAAPAMVALLARAPAVASQAAGALRNLSAGAGPGRAAALAAGAVEPLSRLVLALPSDHAAGGDEATEAAYRSAAALCNLAGAGREARDAVRAQAGVVAAIERMLGGGNQEAKAVGLLALLRGD